MASYFARLLLCFCFRFITPDDEQWFNAHLIRAVEENVSPDVGSYILPEPYFVDFLCEMPEPTGEEPEDTVFEVPKIYELVFIFSFLDHLPNQIFAVTCTIVICYDSCHHTPSKILISVKFSRNPIKVRYKTSTRTIITVI